MNAQTDVCTDSFLSQNLGRSPFKFKNQSSEGMCKAKTRPTTFDILLSRGVLHKSLYLAPHLFLYPINFLALSKCHNVHSMSVCGYSVDIYSLQRQFFVALYLFENPNDENGVIQNLVHNDLCPEILSFSVIFCLTKPHQPKAMSIF